MEQNEQIEDNGVENFADQGKYSGVGEKKERNAALLGKVSLIMSVMCIVLGVVCVALTEKPFELGERTKEILLWLPIVLEIVTVLICICGLCNKRTILLKRILWGHVLYWGGQIFKYSFIIWTCRTDFWLV